MRASWADCNFFHTVILNCHLVLFYRTKNELFFSWIVTCDRNWIIYDNRLSSVLELRGSSKILLKAKCEANDDAGRYLVSTALLILCSLPTPLKPLHLRSVLRKSMRCIENCISSSQHWSTDWAQFVSTIPSHMWPVKHFKRWMSWTTKKSCLIHHIHLTFYKPPLLQDFCMWRKCFHSQWDAENAWGFLKSWFMGFYTIRLKTATKKPILFLVGKNVLITMVPISVNEDMWAQL